MQSRGRARCWGAAVLATGQTLGEVEEHGAGQLEPKAILPENEEVRVEKDCLEVRRTKVAHGRTWSGAGKCH